MSAAEGLKKMFKSNRARSVCSPRWLAYMLTASLVLFGAGCDETYEERKEKRERTYKEEIKDREIAENNRIKILEKTYGAIYFPPKNINGSSFTYKIQKFFKDKPDSKYIFDVYVEDIEEKEGRFIGEFSLRIGNNFIDENMILLRLNIGEDMVSQFLEGGQKNSILSSLRYFWEPDYVVIVRVTDVQRTRKYEFEGSRLDGDEVEIKPSVNRGLLITGNLIKAAAIPKSKE